MIGYAFFMIFLGYRTFISSKNEKYVLLAIWSVGFGIAGVLYGIMVLITGVGC